MKVPVSGFTILDHTADIGLLASGPNLEEAFVNAAKGMFSIIAHVDTPVSPLQPFSIEVEADSLADLLISWLNRLLYLYDTEKVLFSHFEILELKPTKLLAKVAGEPIQDKHKINTYIKAATYHDVQVIQNEHCTLRVIFDV